MTEKLSELGESRRKFWGQAGRIALGLAALGSGLGVLACADDPEPKTERQQYEEALMNYVRRNGCGVNRYQRSVAGLSVDGRTGYKIDRVWNHYQKDYVLRITEFSGIDPDSAESKRLTPLAGWDALERDQRAAYDRMASLAQEQREVLRTEQRDWAEVSYEGWSFPVDIVRGYGVSYKDMIEYKPGDGLDLDVRINQDVSAPSEQSDFDGHGEFRDSQRRAEFNTLHGNQPWDVDFDQARREQDYTRTLKRIVLDLMPPTEQSAISQPKSHYT